MAKQGFRQIFCDLSHFDSSPLAKLLDSCVRAKSARDTEGVHARIIKSRFSSEVYIQNRLIDAYGKCGCLHGARKVFDQMAARNTFTWNSIISTLMNAGFVDEASRLFVFSPQPDQCSWNSMVSGFCQHFRFEESLEYFVMMHKDDFVFNEYSYGSALSACAGLGNLKLGTQIHTSVRKSPHSQGVYVGSALIDMYSKCGNVACARVVFDEMIDRNRVSWNSLITCYEQNGPASEALEVFVQMMDCGLKPDEVTLASVVSACATLSDINKGRQIHSRIVKFDKLRDDLVICNALVDMYSKCNRINEARWVFDRMPIRNVVSETSMVSGYAKVASVESARLMFARMMERNIVSWNALIAGYTQSGDNEEAVGLFRLLKRESVWPTHYTFGNVLNACANLANLQLGRQTHTHVLKHGFRFQSGPETDIFVGNSLIDMYMKCGSVEEGSRAFSNMYERDLVSWNAVLIGYAQNGHVNEALQMFTEMLASGEKPDHVTMIGVLCACSHAGLVEEGRHYFSSMSKEHGLEPIKDHYSCMVDILGRAGCLNEAKNLIESMPMKPDGVVWGSLLAACKVHGDIEIGKFATEKLLELDPSNSGPYILLSNMYAELGKWKDVMRIRKLMRQHGITKQPGCSWIEIENRAHVFMVKDRRHPQIKEIYLLLKTLAKMMKRSGYVPLSGDLEADVEEQDKSCEEFEATLTAATA